MKNKKNILIIAFGIFLLASILLTVNLFNKQNLIENEPEPFEVIESVEVNDDIFGGGLSSIEAGNIGEAKKQSELVKISSIKKLDVPLVDPLVKPKIGYQVALKDEDSNGINDHISIRYTAAITSLDVDSATWTRAMYEADGDKYAGLVEAEKAVTKAYTAITTNGVQTYATSLEDENGDHPYNYFVVYTLLNIPLDDYGKYYLDACLTLEKEGNSITSTVGAVEVDNEDFFSYERGTIDSLIFTETTVDLEKVLTVKGNSSSYSTDIVIPGYYNNGNGRYMVNQVELSGFYDFKNLEIVVIPDSVTSIGSSAFSKCSSLERIMIPNSVTSIGYSAFSQCTSLESITISNSMTIIDSSLFSQCTSLSSVTIPNSVRSIENGAFYKCTSLASITIPSSVTSIGNSVFSCCSSLEHIVVDNNSTYDSRNNCNAIIVTSTNTLIQGCISTIIPNSVTSIAVSAFAGMAGLTNIEIPNSVTAIGESAFAGCSSLSNITLPNNLTAISNNLFSGSSLESIVIPNSVISIGNSAFEYCYSLTTVTMSDSVETMGTNVFYSCNSLTNVTLSKSLTRIENNTFGYCQSLKCITIPNSVTSIGAWAFQGCIKLVAIVILNNAISIADYAFNNVSNMKQVFFSGSSDNWEELNINDNCQSYAFTVANIEYNSAVNDIQMEYATNYSYILTDTDEVYCIKVTNYSVIEEDFSDLNSYSVKSMVDEAFSNCKSLVSISLPYGLSTIDNRTFSGCTSLANVIIPTSVTSIGEYVFDGCSSLINITIPSSITSIGAWAFFKCTSLASITIPSSVTSMGYNVFCSCDSIQINCVVSTKPEGWDDYWNSGRIVIWGYTE